MRRAIIFTTGHFLGEAGAMEATDGTMLLRSADDDVARLRAILAAHPVATDDTTLIEFVQVSRRILRHASDMGWERVTAAATRIADLAQDCFPSELNFCRGANLQLHDLWWSCRHTCSKSAPATHFPARPQRLSESRTGARPLSACVHLLAG